MLNAITDFFLSFSQSSLDKKNTHTHAHIHAHTNNNNKTNIKTSLMKDVFK